MSFESVTHSDGSVTIFVEHYLEAAAVFKDLMKQYGSTENLKIHYPFGLTIVGPIDLQHEKDYHRGDGKNETIHYTSAATTKKK